MYLRSRERLSSRLPGNGHAYGSQQANSAAANSSCQQRKLLGTSAVTVETDVIDVEIQAVSFETDLDLHYNVGSHQCAWAAGPRFTRCISGSSLQPVPNEHVSQLPN